MNEPHIYSTVKPFDVDLLYFDDDLLYNITHAVEWWTLFQCIRIIIMIHHYSFNICSSIVPVWTNAQSEILDGKYFFPNFLLALLFALKKS